MLARVHTAIRAWFVRRERIKFIEKKFVAAHTQELRVTPVQDLPVVLARQQMEIETIRAGRLEIVDRKSWAWPFLPASVTRLATPIMKATPYNLRRMSRTPVPRRAINMIKGALISQIWDIRPIKDEEADDKDEQEERIRVAKKVFHHPNNDDSFQTFIEQGLEDMLVFGAFVAELRSTLDPERPLKLWPVNVESIRVFPSWSESTPDMPRYAQMTGLKGERGAVLFWNDTLIYVRDNPATDNPFGLGKMEVAFQQVNDLLGVHGMAGRAGTDQVHKTWLWWEQPQSDSAYQIVRRHIQNELEGQSKVSIIGGMKKPEVLEIQPVTEEDLLLNWQEMLIRMVANAFDMSAMALGIERDVNRSTGEVLSDQDFRSAVVPVARRLQEALTRKVLHEKLGWYDLEFAFVNLDDPDKSTMMDMLSRMYSENAVSPNEIRIKMGMEPKANPIYDLAQVEVMLLIQEATMKVQNQQQQAMMDWQQKKQDEIAKQQSADSLAGLFGPMGPGGMIPGTPEDEEQGPMPPQGPPTGPPAAKGAKFGQQPPQEGKLKAPQKVALPKFPISGSRYNAKQVARMPVNQISDLIGTGQLPPKKTLLRDMQHQEPSILEQMNDEVRQFFEEEEKHQEQETKKKSAGKATKKLSKELKQKVTEEDARDSDMNEWIYKRRGQKAGKPGTSPVSNKTPLNSDIGKPGKLNPTKRS